MRRKIVTGVSLEKRVVTAIALACVMSGCASRALKSEASTETQSDAAAEKSSRVSLAKPPLSGRNLAAEAESFTGELSEQALQRYFDGLWGSIDPAREIERNLEMLVRIYYRSEHQLRAFDNELDQAVAAKRGRKHLLAEMESYPKMLAHWELSHRALQRMTYVYDRLLDIRADSERDSSDYKRAESALQAFHRFIQRAQGADRLALHAVSIELKGIFDRSGARERAETSNKTSHLFTSAPFANALFEGPEKVGDFAKKAEIQNELLQKSQVETRPDADDFDNEFDENLDVLHTGIREELSQIMESNREPQADGPRFFPSSGSHGSISGIEYPKGTWSLTFDDGPSTKYTPMVLKNLKDHGLHSTFFELATNVDSDKKTSLSVLNAGMEMANHSYTHPQLPKLDDAHLRHEVVDSTKVEVKVWGEDHRPKLFRCPYGAGLTIKRVRDMIAEQGFIHVFWNVDTLDWQDKNPDSILARAKKEMAAEGGGIILFHDIHPQSVEASRMVMDWIQQKGYRHKKVGEMVEELNARAAQNEKKNN